MWFCTQGEKNTFINSLLQSIIKKGIFMLFQRQFEKEKFYLDENFQSKLRLFFFFQGHFLVKIIHHVDQFKPNS